MFLALYVVLTATILLGNTGSAPLEHFYFGSNENQTKRVRVFGNAQDFDNAGLSFFSPPTPVSQLTEPWRKRKSSFGDEFETEDSEYYDDVDFSIAKSKRNRQVEESSDSDEYDNYDYDRDEIVLNHLKSVSSDAFEIDFPP